MQFHDRLDDRQPKAAGLGGPAAGRIGAIEAIEQSFKLLDGDRRAVILDRDRRGVVVLFAYQANGRVWRAVAQRVDDEVVNGSSAQGGIHESRSIGLYREAEAGLVRGALEVLRDSLQLVVHRDRCALDVQYRMIGMCEEKDVVDDQAQPI